jgi:hypothetical protein
MKSDKQRRIEQRAYALWEAEGQPHGRHEEHWTRAAREIESEETASDIVQRSARRTSGKGGANSGTHSPQRRKRAGVMGGSASSA